MTSDGYDSSVDLSQQESIVDLSVSVPVRSRDSQYYGSPLDQQQGNVQAEQEVVAFTQEDFNECWKTGFVTRGIPFAMAGCGVVYMANRMSKTPLSQKALLNRYILMALINSTVGEVLYLPECKARKVALARQQAAAGADWPREQTMRQYDQTQPQPAVEMPTGPITMEQARRIISEQMVKRGITTEQRFVLKQCGREATLYRSVPLTAVVWGAMLAAKQFAPLPLPLGVGWFVGAGFVSYMLGQASYTNICRRRLAENLVQMSRSAEFATPPAQQSQSEFSNDPDASGYDDTSAYNPTFGNEVDVENAPMQKQSTLTYDELRRRNRQQYIDKMRPVQQQPPPGYNQNEQQTEESHDLMKL